MTVEWSSLDHSARYTFSSRLNIADVNSLAYMRRKGFRPKHRGEHVSKRFRWVLAVDACYNRHFSGHDRQRLD